MKFISLFTPIIGLALFISCSNGVQNPSESPMPKPTDGTIITFDKDGGQKRLKREAWFELLHQSAPNIHWMQIEDDRSWETHISHSGNPGKRLDKRSTDPVAIAGGLLTGRWEEKGSNNQAGSVIATTYDVDSDELYVVSAGGSLYRSDRNGEEWTVVNQALRLGGELLEFITHENSQRLVAIVNRVPAFSDDYGISWTPVKDWMPYTDNWGNVYKPVISNESGHIYLLAKPSFWSNLSLFVSTDGGETYSHIRELGSHQPSKYKLCAVHNSDDVILADRVNEENIDFYKYDTDSNTLDLVSISRDKGYGEAAANLAATQTKNGSVWFYMYDGKNTVHFSDDMGATWEKRDSIGERPWGVGLFVSPSNPEALLIGAVQCYRSLNGGEEITMINTWQEYYRAVETKLHADMMFFNEFTTSAGSTFTTISNHGGLNLSYDYGLTTPSISLEGLTVSQYYSVRTDPINAEYIYAGSQDQGFQRGVNENEGPIDFDQTISGDYGHIVFSNAGRHLWSVYPGGWVIYYRDAQNEGWPTHSYTLESDDETVWLPPLAETHQDHLNEVLLAGGSIHGGPGSHLIRLYVSLNSISADQFDYNFKAASNGGTISAIHVSPVNKDLYYVATTNGQFFHSEDAGYSWTKSLMNVPGGHYLYGASIVSSSYDVKTVYMGGSGYSNAPVVITSNGGRSFRPFRNGLPSTTVFQLALDEDERFLYAATEAGPYVCVLDEAQWYPMAQGVAPNQTYWTVEYLEDQDVVRFGTYGRGIWDFHIESAPTSTKSVATRQKGWEFYPNPVSESFNVNVHDATLQSIEVLLSNTSGQILQRLDFSGQSGRFSLSDYVPGVYLVGLKTETDISWKQIIIQ